MSVIYVDSSIALRAIFNTPSRLHLDKWLSQATNTYVSSRLLKTEVIRVLRRDGRPPSDGAPLLQRVGMFAITDETLTVAESIERHIKTPDSIHLATALLIGQPATVATHDRAMQEVAAHLGLQVIDPVERVI